MKQRKQKPAAEALPAKQQRALESALQRRAADAESIVEFVDRTSLAGDEEEVAGELTTTDQHPADTADVAFQRELDLTVREMAEAREARAEEALQRLQDGTYGICTECGKRIELARLEALPDATTCIDCARRKEHVPR